MTGWPVEEWIVQGGVVAGAYLIGSLPTGYLVGRWLRGGDIRQYGSGNPGAANVFRVMGTGAGILTLAVDISKGILPVLIAQWLAGRTSSLGMQAGVAAIAGHNWTPWLRFRGGKGVATSAGVCVTLLPAACGIALSVFALTSLATRYISVGSIAAASALPLAAWWLGSPAPLRIFALIAGGLVIWRHVPNLKRLSRGEEPRFRWNRGP